MTRTSYVVLFKASCRHPAGTDLISYTDSVAGLPAAREPTPAEIAAVALPDRP